MSMRCSSRGSAASASTFAARENIREGSNKILLVIDQFEQWYHARGAEPGTELAKALAECDGGRVQAILLIRDDFSMALHRFMAVIGVRQNQDQNFAVVDLFDLQHARKVLLLIHGGTWASRCTFDPDPDHGYSMMEMLADAGYDAFALDQE